MTHEQTSFETIDHQADFCIVGGGMAGLCAALAAARRGARTILMHERPVLGGNASSEIGVHIIGADRVGKIPHMRETGVLEELRLANLAGNPQASLSVWDVVLYDAARREPDLQVLFNCSCLDAAMSGRRLASVTGWQQTTQRRHTVHARLFADCSGDAVLAPLTGASCRMGREGREEYGESIAPRVADNKTMGMSYIFYTREHDRPIPFTPPEWARTFENCDDLPWGADNHAFWLYSPWWCELGGEDDTIGDTEALRERLLALIMGVWDHIKNRCVHSERAANWALERVQFLPGKRESRRYVGAHVLTQGDIERGGRFEDLVAYGGWTMDDHHPAGFEAAARGFPCTIHHPAPSPYGIPWRSLYSVDVPNLMFAGRLAACTHVAMSSTRVMGTCCSMGQAVGTAAALATREGLEPAQVGGRIGELQQMLLADDAYLPGVRQEISEVTQTAEMEASAGDPQALRDGVNRQVGENEHCWHAGPGAHVTLRWPAPVDIEQVTVVLDSAMERSIALRGPGWQPPLPEVIVRRLRLEVQEGDNWLTAARLDGNVQRCVHLQVGRRTSALRLTIEETNGAENCRLYALLVNPPYAR